jgi:hypothetical protein
MTAEVGLRVYQRDAPRVAIRQIRQMVKRAVDVFFDGAQRRDMSNTGDNWLKARDEQDYA